MAFVPLLLAEKSLKIFLVKRFSCLFVLKLMITIRIRQSVLNVGGVITRLLKR